MIVNIGVKDIVRFLYSGGDLTNEFFINKKNQDGHNAHLYLQKKYDEGSQKEVYLKHHLVHLEHEITITGYIDGILLENDQVIIEEIKSTKLHLHEITLDYHEEYLAQAKMYAYIYACQNSMSAIKVRLTYIELEKYETKSFDITYDVEELDSFFYKTITKYLDWALILDKASNDKINSIKEMEFPFPNKRSGQRDLMKACFYAMTEEEIMYAIAPTGIGKTMATLYSSLKCVTKSEEKLFYLTAKGTGKTVAVDSIRRLMDKGLKIKTLVLTSKSKSCLNAVKNCDPEKCRFAKGFFDRLKDAAEEIFIKTDLFDFDTVNLYALKHEICSFEFALYLSYFCDLIIADYNYVFDPKAHLIRYFDDDAYKPKILIDEAHNLITRSKDMYSASLSTINLTNLRKSLNTKKPTIKTDISNVLNKLNTYEEKIPANAMFFSEFNDEEIYIGLKKICGKCEQIFADNKEFKNREEALEEYFVLKDYLMISELYGSSHRFLVKKIDEDFTVTLSCLDASKYILDIIKARCFGVVFFSATLYPLKYHMDLLTKGEGKYLVLPSPFKQENLKLIIRDNISTKYKDRQNSLDEIVSTIKILVKSKIGNYIVFFPSYQYLEMVSDVLADSDIQLIIQKPSMSDYERDVYFDLFKDSTKTKLGLFVMGGVFSEGMDYVGDYLSGAVIVGVGLPQVNFDNNLLKSYFDEKYDEGFDYAYTYPGFTKVVQASGRVIRSEDDRGVVILIDERFGYNTYRKLMPNEWHHYQKINYDERLEIELKRFWKNEKN